MFKIPPGANNYRVEAAYRFGQDTLLYTLLPHMHLRGKSFRFTAEYPDGKSEVLLDVPRYEFAWQHMDQLAEPKLMPEGSKLRCAGVFDNSAENLSNPDPTASVAFGLQTSEEMLVGYFDMGLAYQDLTLGGPQVTAVGNDEYDVLFKYRAPSDTKSVFLAGSFNEWKTDAHPMDGPDENGLCSTHLKLKKGEYEYKFVLEGKTWKHDPANRRQKGIYNNSVLTVGKQ